MPCPDCGGSGQLPSPSTLVDWRIRDIERAYGNADGQAASDVRWLVAELQRARRALTEIVALTQDSRDATVLPQVAFVANRALALYEVKPVDPEST